MELCFLISVGNPESNPLRCIDIIFGKKNEIMKCGICVVNPLSAYHNKSRLPMSSAEIFKKFYGIQCISKSDGSCMKRNII